MVVSADWAKRQEKTLFLQKATVQEPDDTRAADGEKAPNWFDVVGLVDLPCALANVSGRGIQAIQRRRGDSHSTRSESYRLMFPERYTQITKLMRIVSDGVAYEIVGVDHGSQGSVTRLRLEIVGP